MKMPEIDATVEWRLLVNYRVDAEVAARLLPALVPAPNEDDPTLAGPATLDRALLMPDVPVTWHALDPMRNPQPAASTAP